MSELIDTKITFAIFTKQNSYFEPFGCGHYHSEEEARVLCDKANKAYPNDECYVVRIVETIVKLDPVK
jgi:hypothetical protein